ncbi:MAG: acetate kinase [Clostridia bacterium]|nr:acetate kinase [Clostridia bacterium]
MNILVINAGSSSLKYQLINMDNESVIAKGICEKIGLADSFCVHKCKGNEIKLVHKMPTHKEAMQLVLDALTHKEYGAIESMDEIAAVGHRVLHSGEDFTDSVLVTDEVMQICEKNKPLGPLHMGPNISGVYACQEVMPNAPMALVFDTSFHLTMPAYAYMYALPYEDYEKYKIRRYGFHGTSHKFVSGEAAKFLCKDFNKIKMITTHLGNGSSLAAIKDGKVIDTSMGFTPLEGLPMGTRTGDIDPACLEFLASKTGKDIHELLLYANKKSGMLGLSGISSDFRDLREAANNGNQRAQLALDVFAYHVKKYIGSYVAALGGLDVLVFTAGVGENDVDVRKAATSNLEYLGIYIDQEKNAQRNNGQPRIISTDDSPVTVVVVPTNEELVIARETKRLAKL